MRCSKLQISCFRDARDAKALAKTSASVSHPAWNPWESLRHSSRNQALPIIFGGPELTVREKHVSCGVDIFGTAFFMLSRLEELANPARDRHGRFPGRESLAYKAGFLERPIVDEYTDLLRAVLRHLQPELPLRTRSPNVFATCDVDQPFDCAAVSSSAFLRTAAGDIVKRRQFRSAARRTRKFIDYRIGDHSRDENYTFEWYMRTCEKANLTAAFFFIPRRSSGSFDGCSDVGQRAVRKLIRRIAQRGHEVGVHGSYGSYLDSDLMRREHDAMCAACRKVGIDIRIRGNRQHYLRWGRRNDTGFTGRRRLRVRLYRRFRGRSWV